MGGGSGRRPAAGPRRIFSTKHRHDAAVYDRDAPPSAGQHLDGPAIVEQDDTTTLVPAGFRVDRGRLRQPRHRGRCRRQWRSDKVTARDPQESLHRLSSRRWATSWSAPPTRLRQGDLGLSTGLIDTEGEIFCLPAEHRRVGNYARHRHGSRRSAASTTTSRRRDRHRTIRTPLGALCTHLPDIILFKPLFFEGKLLCFAWCFVHSSDVGGLVPGSISPRAIDDLPGGSAVPPTKLCQAGELNEELSTIYPRRTAASRSRTGAT